LRLRAGGGRAQTAADRLATLDGQRPRGIGPLQVFGEELLYDIGADVNADDARPATVTSSPALAQ
jgi:hypothetical protein